MLCHRLAQPCACPLHALRMRLLQRHAASRASCPRRCSGGPRRQVTRMMPIGVPRVPYRAPQAGGWQWVDIWNCLVRCSPVPQLLHAITRQHTPTTVVGKLPTTGKILPLLVAPDVL